jgi:SAM-dependent methyltransferase
LPEFIKYPRDTLLQYERLIHQRIYTNANPLVRWIFWRRLAKLLEFSSAVERGRVLDFGCGEGAFLPSLCSNFKDVVAVDVDVAAARALAGHYGLDNLSILKARAPTLPFADGIFDFIVAADVLEHVRDLDPVVKELARLLAPGGRLVISAPSENVLYEVGRKIFGFTKPDDHFHTPRDIEKRLSLHFELHHRRLFPLPVLQGLSAFVLFSFGPTKRDGRHPTTG